MIPVSARQFGIKDMLELILGGGIVWEVTRVGLRPTFVTLIDRCSFLCVSGQRGTIAKSMHEEHLCVVALTSNGERNPVLFACLLPPCVIAYYTALRLLSGE